MAEIDLQIDCDAPPEKLAVLVLLLEPVLEMGEGLSRDTLREHLPGNLHLERRCAWSGVQGTPGAQSGRGARENDEEARFPARKGDKEHALETEILLLVLGMFTPGVDLAYQRQNC